MRIFMELFFPWSPVFCCAEPVFLLHIAVMAILVLSCCQKKTSLRVEDFFGALFLDYYYFF